MKRGYADARPKAVAAGYVCRRSERLIVWWHRAETQVIRVHRRIIGPSLPAHSLWRWITVGLSSILAISACLARRWRKHHTMVGSRAH